MCPLPIECIPFQISWTMTDINEEDRRKAPDRRAGMDRREGRDRRRIEDRNNARRLPDEFAQAAGGSNDRVNGLVNRYWADYDEPARGELVEALIPILDELVEPGAPVTDMHRDKCVDVVVDWSARLETVSQD